MTDPAPMSVHPEFNASDADLIVQSADNVRFHLHRKYLEAHTGSFPGPGDTPLYSNPRGRDEDVTPLSEPAKVLEILFQFVYPKRQPPLEDVQYDILGPLAEAAEKYEVFSAIGVCTLTLRRFIPQHGPEILGHAIKHDCSRLADETALYLMRGFAPMTTIAEHLPPHAFIPWLRYHEAWKEVLDEERDRQSSSRNRDNCCGSCANQGLNLPVQVIIDHESRIYDGENAFHDCRGCSRYSTLALRWEDGPVHDKMPSLADFLAGKPFDKKTLRPDTFRFTHPFRF